MEALTVFQQISSVVTFVVGLGGCFLLHFRQRSVPSLTFLIAVILLSAWSFSYYVITGYAYSGAAIPVLDVMYQVNEPLVSVLSLLAAATFAISMNRTASARRDG